MKIRHIFLASHILLLVVLHLVSVRYTLWFTSPHRFVTRIGNGMLIIHVIKVPSLHIPDPNPPIVAYGVRRYVIDRFAPLPSMTTDGRGTVIQIPIYTLALASITLIYALLLLRLAVRRNRLKARQCVNCKYNLNNIAGNNCPECGAMIGGIGTP